MERKLCLLGMAVRSSEKPRVSEKVGLGPLIWVHGAQFVSSCIQDKGLDQEHLIRTRNKLLRRNKTLPRMKEGAKENVPEASGYTVHSPSPSLLPQACPSPHSECSVPWMKPQSDEGLPGSL